jgi:hypothetical protein
MRITSSMTQEIIILCRYVILSISGKCARKRFTFLDNNRSFLSRRGKPGSLYSSLYFLTMQSVPPANKKFAASLFQLE